MNIMPDIDSSGNLIWFSALPASCYVQLDWALLLHVLTTDLLYSEEQQIYSEVFLARHV
jgi:hypothetical protein